MANNVIGDLFCPVAGALPRGQAPRPPQTIIKHAINCGAPAAG